MSATRDSICDDFRRRKHKISTGRRRPSRPKRSITILQRGELLSGITGASSSIVEGSSEYIHQSPDDDRTGASFPMFFLCWLSGPSRWHDDPSFLWRPNYGDDPRGQHSQELPLSRLRNILSNRSITLSTQTAKALISVVKCGRNLPLDEGGSSSGPQMTVTLFNNPTVVPLTDRVITRLYPA